MSERAAFSTDKLKELQALFEKNKIAVDEMILARAQSRVAAKHTGEPGQTRHDDEHDFRTVDCQKRVWASVHKIEHGI
jgi:hypothetical protein